jgi:hypothetical protein
MASRTLAPQPPRAGRQRGGGGVPCPGATAVRSRRATRRDAAVCLRACLPLPAGRPGLCGTARGLPARAAADDAWSMRPPAGYHDDA